MKIRDKQSTKIVATLGPASRDEEMLLKLIENGTDIFRLNFSHGDHATHGETIKRIVNINKQHNLHIGILADLQGPKLRVGDMTDGGVELNKGDEIIFTNEECMGTKERAYMSYERFAKDVSVGEKILVDDGTMMFEVVNTDSEKNVTLKTLYGGILKSNKGVNLPDTNISLPAMTEKDLIDLKYILTQPVHWIALSFVRTAEEIRDLKAMIKESGHIAKVIAKIEKPEAVKNIKEIIKATDAIMVARGDLGVEVPIEKIPFIQKNIIKRCIQKAKPVIVATQMMDSMITNFNPTRAEVTDVANAVHDGADAVMLSGETSVGNHPERVVEAMSNIIEEAEKNYMIQGKRAKTDKSSKTFHSDVICITAAKTAEEVNAKAILSVTESGYTAFKISSYRPPCRIYVFTSQHEMSCLMNLVWGVKSLLYNKFTTTDETIEDLTNILKEKEFLKKGDVVINTGSMPIKRKFRTNMLKLTVIE